MLVTLVMVLAETVLLFKIMVDLRMLRRKGWVTKVFILADMVQDPSAIHQVHRKMLQPGTIKVTVRVEILMSLWTMAVYVQNTRGTKQNIPHSTTVLEEMKNLQSNF